jgi:hypothetical protein
VSRKPFLVFALLACMFIPLAAFAEQSQNFGDYTVHYNALTTDALQPAIARAYGITRSKNRVLLNVTVLKRVMGTTGKPVSADVSARAINLNNQLKTMEMREVDDGGGIYYLGEVTVDHGETLTFIVEVSPEGTHNTYTFEFQQRFFTK